MRLKHGRARSGMAVVLASAIALALSGCGGIDTDKLEEEISADSDSSLQEAGSDVTVSSVSCPDDISSETGEPFECTLEWSDDTTGTVTGEVTDGDNGDVEYQIAPD